MYKLWQSPYIELTLAWSFYKPFEIFTVNLRKIIGASQKWLKGKPKANQLRTCACKMSLKPIYRSSYLSSYWVIHIISNHFKSFQIISNPLFWGVKYPMNSVNSHRTQALAPEVNRGQAARRGRAEPWDVVFLGDLSAVARLCTIKVRLFGPWYPLIINSPRYVNHHFCQLNHHQPWTSFRSYAAMIA